MDECNARTYLYIFIFNIFYKFFSFLVDFFFSRKDGKDSVVMFPVGKIASLKECVFC